MKTSPMQRALELNALLAANIDLTTRGGGRVDVNTRRSRGSCCLRISAGWDAPDGGRHFLQLVNRKAGWHVVHLSPALQLGHAANPLNALRKLFAMARAEADLRLLLAKEGGAA